MTRVCSSSVDIQTTRDANSMITSGRRLGRLSRSLLIALMAVATGLSVSAPGAVADPPPLQVNDFIARSLDAVGNDYTVAGGHPYEATTSFTFPADAQHDVEDVRKVFVELPPGFVGNVAAATRCTIGQMAADTCPAGSAVGTVELETNTPPVKNPVSRIIVSEPTPITSIWLIASEK